MTVNRRSVIKNAGVLSATLLAPGLPLWAHANEPPSQAAPADYIGLSAALIDVGSEVLSPTLIQDNLSLADLYYSVCVAGIPDGLNELLVTYRNLVAQGSDPQQIADALLRNGTDPNQPRGGGTGPAARLTMMMWLFGIWYGATEVANVMGSATYIVQDYRVDFVVSSRAYKNSWIWRFAQAHPMGFSHYRFGSWASAPPALDDFTNPLG